MSTTQINSIGILFMKYLIHTSNFDCGWTYTVYGLRYTIQCWLGIFRLIPFRLTEFSAPFQSNWYGSLTENPSFFHSICFFFHSKFVFFLIQNNWNRQIQGRNVVSSILRVSFFVICIKVSVENWPRFSSKHPIKRKFFNKSKITDAIKYLALMLVEILQTYIFLRSQMGKAEWNGGWGKTKSSVVKCARLVITDKKNCKRSTKTNACFKSIPMLVFI